MNFCLSTVNLLGLWNIVEVIYIWFPDNTAESYHIPANIQKHRKGVGLEKKKSVGFERNRYLYNRFQIFLFC